MSNILKRSRERNTQETDWLNQVIDKVTFQNAVNLLTGTSTTYRYFKVFHNGAQLEVIPQMTPDVSTFLQEWLPKLDHLDAIQWVDFFKTKNIEVNMEMERNLFKLLHRDIAWVRSAYLMQRYPGLSDSFTRYLETSTAWSRQQVSLDRTFVRASFFEINKTSLLYNKATQQIQRPGLLKSLREKLDALPWVQSIEVQEGFDPAKLSVLLGQLHQVLTSLKVKPAHTFHLKLRKIRRHRKTGMYMPSVKLIVVDPRETRSLWHELGHWLEQENLVETPNFSDSEVDFEVKEKYPKGDWEKEMKARWVEKRIDSLLRKV